MKYDLRLPIGLLFLCYGILLSAYGLLSDGALYERSLGININLIWGLVLLGFGMVMLLLCFRGRRGDPRS